MKDPFFWLSLVGFGWLLISNVLLAAERAHVRRLETRLDFTDLHVENLLGKTVMCPVCLQEIPPVTGTHVCADGKLIGFPGTTFGRSETRTKAAPPK
jgi:hypothetical protein